MDSTERYRYFFPNMPVTEQNEQSNGQPRDVCTITVLRPPITQSAVPPANEKSGTGRASRSPSQAPRGLC